MIQAPILPHIGWNTVEPAAGSELFRGIENDSFYFVHSYGVKKSEGSLQVTQAEYGEKFIAAVEHKNISATQFHPEKSGDAGIRLIKNWAATL